MREDLILTRGLNKHRLQNLSFSPPSTVYNHCTPSRSLWLEQGSKETQWGSFPLSFSLNLPSPLEQAATNEEPNQICNTLQRWSFSLLAAQLGSLMPVIHHSIGGRTRAGSPTQGLCLLLGWTYRMLTFRQVCQNLAFVWHNTQSYKTQHDITDNIGTKEKKRDIFSWPVEIKSDFTFTNTDLCVVCSPNLIFLLYYLLFIMLPHQIKRGEERKQRWELILQKRQGH